MLKVLRCAHPDEKRELFAGFQPERQAWIVSDLQSKWHLQRQILERHGVLEEQSVLRATELWRRLGFQLLPEVRVLSRELAQTLFWNWIEPLNLPWARSPRAVPVLLRQMQMWMSIFADPGFEEIMSEWFQANPEAFVRWGHWFELCARIWNRCQEENLVMVSWLPALIANQNLDELQWTRELIFDLGPQMTQVEGLLLRDLSRRFDVHVLFPDVPWSSLMPSTLAAYETLLSESGVKASSEVWEPDTSESLTYGRFSTQLAEVKDAVAQVRAWLDAGVAPGKIAVVAPDIEDYWPTLRMYFQEEGVPVNKDSTARLGSFPEMAQWMSSLRTGLRQINSADLELHFFTGGSQPRLSYDEFRVLFSHVYDEADLHRAGKLFASEVAPPESKALSMAEFLAWGLRFWDAGANTERLLSLLNVIGREVPRELELRPSEWSGYLVGLLAGREMALRKARDEGIWCVSLNSVDWLDVTHGIALNLSENALRRIEPTPMNQGEAQKIFADTGFALGSADRQELEFLLLWFMNRPWSALRLTTSGTDFQGQVLTASRLWMWSAMVNQRLSEELEAPRRTRWDEIQRLGLDSLVGWREFAADHALGLQTGFARDRSIEVNTWKPSAKARISASGLERFWNCPFQFAAERKLKLNDDPALDLDLDHRTRGQLLHALVEELLKEPVRFDWSEDELEQVIERVRERLNLSVGDERFWPAMKKQHLRLSRLFLNFEKTWRERFPQTATVGREVAFETFWSVEGGKPTAEPTDIVLAGRLDRVDRDDQGYYALIDYKASSSSLRNWGSWLKNREIQLALYAYLLEQGLLGLEKGEVAAANYYVVKDSDRHFGFHLSAETGLYSLEDGHRNLINAEDKAELFKRLCEEIQTAVSAINRGELNPRPADESECPSCTWKGLCRAPHLN